MQILHAIIARFIRTTINLHRFHAFCHNIDILVEKRSLINLMCIYTKGTIAQNNFFVFLHLGLILIVISSSHRTDWNLNIAGGDRDCEFFALIHIHIWDLTLGIIRHLQTPIGIPLNENYLKENKTK